MSYLVFDGDELTLSLYAGKGQLVDSWRASNRGGPHSDFTVDPKEAFVTFIPDGDYEFEPHSQRAPQRHKKDPKADTVSGTYGTLGILRLKDIVVGGHRHQGLGVHAGRQAKYDSWVISRKPLQQVHHASAFYRTNGCIRTTEPAMARIAALIATDPLTVLKIRNNGKHPLEKVKGSAVSRA